ncbi:MAG: undecaprenyl-diphosphate phosphatase [Actinomycetota bacterium]
MFQAIVLGAAQGLTEFVPVSSSAHLVLVPFLLRWPIPSLAFDVAIHLGTLLALLVYFWADLVRMAVGGIRSAVGRGDDRDRLQGRLVVMLAVGTVPAAAAGLLLRDVFESLFERPVYTAVNLLVTAVLLVSGEAFYRRRAEERRRAIDEVGVWDALAMGALQALALSPGISRSGATIVGGLFRGLAREAAARFSFLLAIPAILAAAIVAVPDVPPGTDWGPTIAATAVAAVTGFVTIALLLRYLRTRTMLPFAAYCVALSVASLTVAGTR